MKHLLNFIILSFLQVTSGASADILIPAGSPDTIINVVATNYTDWMSIYGTLSLTLILRRRVEPVVLFHEDEENVSS